MNKTWIIARHEFLTTVRRLSYIILTLSFPLLALFGMLIYVGVVSLGGEAPPPEEQRIGYVDETGMFTAYNCSGSVLFISFDTYGEAKGALLGEEIDEYFMIPENYVEVGRITRYTTERELIPPEDILGSMADFLVANMLSGEVSEDILKRAQSPVVSSESMTYRLDSETGEIVPSENLFVVFGMPFIFTVMFMISLFFTSGFLLQGVAEEKENRLMEILLSSVSARQLLAGKVLGLGAAGLMQIAIWFILSLGLAGLASAYIAPLAEFDIPVSLIFFGIIYFILGYLLFGVIYATMGSLFRTYRESNQWTALVVLPAIVPVMLIGLFIENPEHVVFTVLTLFPLSSPITAVMRLSGGSLPAWELVLSMVLLTASIMAMMWLAAKIFRTSLLMYGKRPGIADIWRYIREG